MDNKKEEISNLLLENYGIEIASTTDFESLTFKDLNLDSLDFAQLVFDIESKFNFKFSKKQEADLPDMTLGQLLVFLGSDCSS